MVDAVYRGNTEELLAVINHLKKYIISFIVVLLILVSIFHFSKNSGSWVPVITVILVLLPAVYYSTVLVLKFCSDVFVPSQIGDLSTMDDHDNRQELKTPDFPYPKSPTPPPSYEEATRNDRYYHQPQIWLPSTSRGGYANSGGYSGTAVPTAIPTVSATVPLSVFAVEQRSSNVTAAPDTDPPGRPTETTVSAAAGARNSNPEDDHTPKIQTIPSVTITMDSDQEPTEIFI